MHTCTHMKTNTATVQHAVVSGVESLTLAHKQASVQPSSPSPQTLACLNLAVRLISSLSTPTGLADTQLTAAFIRTYQVGVQLSRPMSGKSTEGGSRSSQIQNQTWLWVWWRQTLVRKHLTWERPRAQPVVWVVSQHHGQRSSLTSVPPPSNRTNQEKTLERCRGCQRHFWKGCLYRGWGGGQEILAQGVLATQQWLVVMQEKMHSHQLITTVVRNWSAYYFSPRMKQLPSLFPIFFEINWTGEIFLGQGPLLSQFAEQSSIQPFI